MAKFCDQPFDSLEITLNGEAVACSPSWVVGNVGFLPEQTLDEVWDSVRAQTLRASIHDQSFRFCLRGRCPKLESLPDAATVTDPRLRAEIAEGRQRLGRRPRRLVLSYDPSCDLACPICRDGPYLVGDPARQQRLALITDRLIAALGDWPEAKTLVVGTEGEPLVSPHYRRLLAHLATADVGPLRLELETNGQRLDQASWQDLVGLERHDLGITVAMDAAWPWAYERQRPGGTWFRLVEGLRFLAGLRAAGRLKRYAVTMVVEAANYHQMPMVVEMGKLLGCDRVEFRRLVRTGPHLDATFAARDIASARHPEHPAFLEVLCNPLFSAPPVDLAGLAGLRANLPQAGEQGWGLLGLEAHLGLVMAASQQATPLETLKAAARGLQAFPDNDQLWLWAGLATMALGASGRAATLLRRAVDIAPHNQQACQALQLAEAQA